MVDKLNQSFEPLKWISKFHIDHKKVAALCFKESLLICPKNEIIWNNKTDSIGNCKISIESIGPQKDDFLINTKFSMNIGDHFCGSKVICLATNQLNCLEEKRVEYVCSKDNLNEKTLFIGIQGDSYYIETTETYQCNSTRNRKDLTYPQNIKLLSEGTNLLLMRYLSIINYNGTLTFGNIMIDGNIATCQYKCSSAKYMKLYKNNVKVYVIERIIENRNGSIENMKTYLTLKGKILEHNWSSTSYVLKGESLENVKQINEKLRIAIRNDYWMEDMEMFHKYLDEKHNKVTKFIEYLTDHVEVKHLIADYTQTLLIVKPPCVVDFTIQYFKAFSICPEVEEDFISTCDISNIAIPTQQLEYRRANICNFYYLCMNCRMVEQQNQLFDESMSSDCLTDSMCSNNISYIRKESNDSNTSVLNLDISMENTNEK